MTAALSCASPGDTDMETCERSARISELVQAAARRSDRALEALLRAAIAERLGPDVRAEDIASRLSQVFTAVGKLTTYYLDDKPILQTRPPDMVAMNPFAASSAHHAVDFLYRQYPV